jgi:hypothetical protein
MLASGPTKDVGLFMQKLLDTEGMAKIACSVLGVVSIYSNPETPLLSKECL